MISILRSFKPLISSGSTSFNSQPFSPLPKPGTLKMDCVQWLKPTAKTGGSVKFSGWYHPAMDLGQVITVCAQSSIDSIDKPDSLGNTALLLATQENKEEVVKFLLKKNANINHQNQEKRTALMEASRKGHGKLVKLLLAHGANSALRDAKNCTAQDLAANNSIRNQLLDDASGSSSKTARLKAEPGPGNAGGASEEKTSEWGFPAPENFNFSRYKLQLQDEIKDLEERIKLKEASYSEYRNEIKGVARQLKAETEHLEDLETNGKQDSYEHDLGMFVASALEHEFELMEIKENFKTQKLAMLKEKMEEVGQEKKLAEEITRIDTELKISKLLKAPPEEVAVLENRRQEKFKEFNSNRLIRWERQVESLQESLREVQRRFLTQQPPDSPAP